MTSFAAFADDYYPARSTATPVVPAASAPSVESLAFTHALVALAAQLSAVDGTPSKVEYLAFQSLFVAEGEADETKLRNLFVKHVGQGGSTVQYARQITAITSGQLGLRQEIFVRFVRIATADGMLNAAEMEWLRVVGTAFDLDAETIRQSIAQCFTAGSSPYAVLGVSAQVDDAALRQAYMARVQALHPDKFQAAGASAETVALLSQQLASVNAAYEAACKARQKKSALPAKLWARRDKSAKADAA